MAATTLPADRVATTPGWSTTTQLKASLRSTRRRAQIRLVLLAAPLLLYTLLGFVWPLAVMLERSIDNSVPWQALTHASAALADWHGTDLPGDEAFDALLADLRAAQSTGKVALLAKYLNYEQDDFRALIQVTMRKVAGDGLADGKAALVAADPRWQNLEYWRVLKRAGQPYTLRNILAAVDLRLSPDGSLGAAPPETRIHLRILGRTIVVSAFVCAICLAVGLPVAFVLASVRPRMRNCLFVFVLLPFWTSVLVRTTAWIVLLQNEGVINKLLRDLHLVDEPLPLMFSRGGVIIAMTHVLLPYMILPIYAAMKALPESYVRASLSLGASPFITIRRVYLPLISPGIRSGCVLVFILALGYYITPALVGGPSDQMFSYLIAFHTTTSLNWGLAAALSAVLLLAVLLLFLAMTRILGPVNMLFERGR